MRVDRVASSWCVRLGHTSEWEWDCHHVEGDWFFWCLCDSGPTVRVVHHKLYLFSVAFLSLYILTFTSNNKHTSVFLSHLLFRASHDARLTAATQRCLYGGSCPCAVLGLREEFGII